MGFYDNASRTVEAILTRKGRELLSKGQDKFKITKFAVSDEGIDYSLYNPDHPSGSDYYGTEITEMPMLEAMPDETRTMRYKLVTLPKGTTKIPSLSVSPSSLTLGIDGPVTGMVVPSTTNTTAGFNNNNYGYTAVLSNTKCADIEVTKVAPNQKSTTTVPSWLSESQLKESKAVVGMEFRVLAKDTKGLSESERSGTITVIGNETGGQAEINYTVLLND